MCEITQKKIIFINFEKEVSLTTVHNHLRH